MNYQYNQAPQPQPRPVRDAAAEKRKKKAAFESLGDKLNEFCGTNPVLSFIAKNSDMLSFIATGVSALLTIIVFCFGSFTMVLPLTVLLLGLLSATKKKPLPLAVSISYIALFEFIIFIVNTVHLFGWYVSGAYIIGYIFSILELAVIGYITYLCWDLFAAMLPPRPVQQPYAPVPPPMQGVPMQQPVQPPIQPPMQPMGQPVPPPQPVQRPAAPQEPPVQTAPPVQNEAPAQNAGVKACPNCGTENTTDSAFCRNCGAKL